MSDFISNGNNAYEVRVIAIKYYQTKQLVHVDDLITF